MFRPTSIQVHPGTFHLDDIICCVQAKILNENVKIIREDAVNKDSNIVTGEIIADVGLGRFDHHQKDAKIREDGYKHCAASLLWEFWGKDVIRAIYTDISDDELNISWKVVNDTMMKTLSITDNGIIVDKAVKFDSATNGMSSIVGLFNPTWTERVQPAEIDERFNKLVDMLIPVFKRYIHSVMDETEAEIAVEELIKRNNNKNILVLDRYISWERAVCNHPEIVMVIYPSLRGGWNIQLAPQDYGSFETKIKVPDSWKGFKYMGNGSSRAYPGMTFCHATGFISAFESCSAAEAGAEFLLEYNESALRDINSIDKDRDIDKRS